MFLMLPTILNFLMMLSLLLIFFFSIWNFLSNILRNDSKFSSTKTTSSVQTEFSNSKCGYKTRRLILDEDMNSSTSKWVLSQIKKLPQATIHTYSITQNSFMSPLLKLPSGSISLLFQSNFNVSKYSLFDMIFWKQPKIMWCQI